MKLAHEFAVPAPGSPVETIDGLLFRHPDRPPRRWRPLKALHHFRKLIADKEDTSQVFHIFEALPRPGFLADARAFLSSDHGRAVRAAEPFLPDLLDDHARLRAMPQGSVAHAYCDFMESEGLSAAGLVAEYAKFDARRFGDLVEYYGDRQRDTHDLLHVLTGYGRDALGEQCVLAFTYGQNPSLANLLIAYLGGLNLRRMVPRDAPLFAAINQALRAGRRCPRVSELSITALLAQPLVEARRQLGIGEPTLYRKAHRRYHAAGIDPYHLLANG